MNFLIVGIGGFLGAVSRYAAGLAVLKYLPGSFPVATLAVNVTGSFCLGLLASLAAQGAVGERLLLLAGVGFLGAFTTFSTFSVDVIYLFKAQQYLLCALNIIINPVLAISAAAIGIKLF